MASNGQPSSNNELGNDVGAAAGAARKAATAGKFVKNAIKKKVKKTAQQAVTSAILAPIKVYGMLFAAIIFLIIIICVMFSSSAINEATHENDAETLSDGRYEYTYAGSADEDKALITQTTDDLHDKINTAFVTARADAITKIQSEFFRRFTDDTQTNNYYRLDQANMVSDIGYSVDDMELYFLFSAYSVANHYYVGEPEGEEDDEDDRTGWKHFEETGGADEIKKILDDLVKQPPNNNHGYLTGNAMVLADFVRDESGMIAERIVVEKDMDTNLELTIHYITPKITAVPYPEVAEQAFGINMDDVYEDDASENSTYYSVIMDEVVSTAQLMGKEDIYKNAVNYAMWKFNWNVNQYGGGDIVDTAEAVLGSDGSPFWNWYYGYNASRVEWCAIFVSWCAAHSTVDYTTYPSEDNPTILKYAYCPTGAAWFKNRGQYATRDSGYVPKRGDIVFFDWSGDKTPGVIDHTGIVAEVTESGNGGIRIRMIEGNTGTPPNDKVNEKYADRNGNGYEVYRWNSIVGFGIPNYPSAEEMSTENARVIYSYLTQELGLNTAAACGVIGNMKRESGCIPDKIEYGYSWASGAGYGLIQWTNTNGNGRTNNEGEYLSENDTFYAQNGLRRTNLVNYCVTHKMNYKSLQGQLAFLTWELGNYTSYSNCLAALKQVPNTRAGVETACGLWLQYLEGAGSPGSSLYETEMNNRLPLAMSMWSIYGRH